MNVEEIFKYKRSTETFYDILGCDQSSSVEQISREYRIRALQLHPDKNPDPESLDKFRKLQTAKDILCDSSSRNSYDSWLSSRIHIPFEQWHNRKGHSMHWATPRSTKLRLEEAGIHRGQGSDSQIIIDENNSSNNKGDSANSLLDKFRRYEI